MKRQTNKLIQTNRYAERHTHTVRHSQHANTYRETDILANTYIRRKRRKVIQVSGEDHGMLLDQDQDLSVRTQTNIEHQRPKPRIELILLHYN